VISSILDFNLTNSGIEKNKSTERLIEALKLRMDKTRVKMAKKNEIEPIEERQSDRGDSESD
jgi:ribosome-interacting GTPase 1